MLSHKPCLLGVKIRPFRASLVFITLSPPRIPLFCSSTLPRRWLVVQVCYNQRYPEPIHCPSRSFLLPRHNPNMNSNAETNGLAYFCQHFPVQQGHSNFPPPLDVPLHPRGPFGERVSVHLSLHEEDPRSSPSFSYVLGNRNEGSNTGSQVVNAGLYGSLVKPLVVNTVQNCVELGRRIVIKTRIWFFKRAS
ncbi:hypothetical protein BJ165DRAFT_608208 [Panaeolus papilionaceus]|nr:hypothetical protein BJ165DRAFT_608208 [Panaeolus papilionaceus]